jgi:putative hydrolase of the HAD superfamily
MTVAIFFDFGNVLGFFSHRRSAEQLAAHSPSATADEVLAFLYGGALEDDFDSGRLAPQEYLALLRRTFDLTGSDEDLAGAVADMFTPNEAVCALVPRLASRYRLALLSNTNALHYAHFRRQFAPTLDRFHAHVVSHQVGRRKPDPGIFDHALAVAGCPPQKCLLIDDMPGNVEAARQRGWQGIVYRPGVDLEALLHAKGITLAA